MTIAALLQSYADLLTNASIPIEKIAGIGIGDDNMIINLGIHCADAERLADLSTLKIRQTTNAGVILSEQRTADLPDTGGKVKLCWFPVLSI